MTTAVQAKYDVGGVLLDRPFKIRRLGHFGFNVANMDAAKRFYIDLLGFKISDVAEFFRARLTEEQIAQVEGDPRGYFTRHNSDHHTFVLFNRQVMDLMRPPENPQITINQITWQVGSLEEVGAAAQFFNERGAKLQRVGRDMPGSNWHAYVYDPDGHTNELYYGIEQVGWEGHSKPRSMYGRGFREAPELPQISEFQEVQDALARGEDIHGYRHTEELPAKYNVQGILLPRPFKVTRIGPVSIFVRDIDAAEAYYRDVMGFEVSETTQIDGQRIVFLRANTEHHSLALYPISLRKTLGFSEHTTSMAFGMQLANYRQLRDACDFLEANGVRVDRNPHPATRPGMDYVAHAFDPDGHCIQLYHYMEQVGWDGKVRPESARRKVENVWPATVEALPDSFQGEPYLGPWG